MGRKAGRLLINSFEEFSNVIAEMIVYVSEYPLRKVPMTGSAIIWIPYVTGKKCQKAGDFVRCQRIIIAIINSIIYVLIIPVVAIIKKVNRLGRIVF